MNEIFLDPSKKPTEGAKPSFRSTDDTFKDIFDTLNIESDVSLKELLDPRDTNLKLLHKDYQRLGDIITQAFDSEDLTL